MKKRKNLNLKAFTLAEILITLSIIGVVAALTIPTLIQRTGNEELVSRLQKSYSTLSQATEAIMTERGAAPSWAVSVDNIYNAYKEKLRISKDCGTASGEGCFKRTLPNGVKGVFSLDGAKQEQWGFYGNTWRTLILSDGASIAFSKNSEAASDCSTASGTNNCGSICVDVNGAKKPNQIGRDIFWFRIKKDGLYPAGVEDTSYNYYNSCNTAGSEDGKIGTGCAARVIAEGDMNY